MLGSFRTLGKGNEPVVTGQFGLILIPQLVLHICDCIVLLVLILKVGSRSLHACAGAPSAVISSVYTGQGPYDKVFTVLYRAFTTIKKTNIVHAVSNPFHIGVEEII